MRDVLHTACKGSDQGSGGLEMKDLEEFAKYSLILMGLMALGWTICVVGLGAMGLL